MKKLSVNKFNKILKEEGFLNCTVEEITKEDSEFIINLNLCDRIAVINVQKLEDSVIVTSENINEVELPSYLIDVILKEI